MTDTVLRCNPDTRARSARDIGCRRRMRLSNTLRLIARGVSLDATCVFVKLIRRIAGQCKIAVQVCTRIARKCGAQEIKFVVQTIHFHKNCQPEVLEAKCRMQRLTVRFPVNLGKSAAVCETLNVPSDNNQNLS